MKVRGGTVLAAAVIGYAFATRITPISPQNDDLFFLLDTARWIVERHEIPWTDVFSYTAEGQPWIYPVGGSLLFYTAWLIGGYWLLSLVGALGAAGAVTLLLRKGTAVSAVLAALAVPAIADRCELRADLFSTVLIAAFVAVLSRYHETGRGRLWALPVLMIVWVNVHLGFFVGLALIGGYVGVECLEMPWAARRRLAVARLRRAWPWLLACVRVTLVNPFGPWLYVAVYDQLTASQDKWIGEWQPLPLTWEAVSSAMFSPLSPSGPTYVMLLVAVGVVAIAVHRRKIGAAVILLGAAMLAMHAERLVGFFGIVTAVVGASVILEALPVRLSRAEQPIWFAAAFVVAFATFRLTAQIGQDGTVAIGLSAEFPERAVAFIEREHLPGELWFSGGGSYQVWRLPQYRDYFDARLIPFGPAGFAKSLQLTASPPGEIWDREADRYNINVIVSWNEDRPLQLQSFCDNEKWAPVFLDEVFCSVRAAPPGNGGSDRPFENRLRHHSLPFGRGDIGSIARRRGDAATVGAVSRSARGD
jgi:hypothetical protein